ncbi:hypothetical protein D3C80_1512160 [compost metagenome]
MGWHGEGRADIDDARHPYLLAGGVEMVGQVQRAGDFLLPAARPQRIVAGAEDDAVEAVERAHEALVIEQFGDPAFRFEVGQALDLR